jgi:hypothetical protein
MSLYEIEIRRVSTVYVTVEADNERAAKLEALDGGVVVSEFIEQQEVIGATLEDDRFDDDDTELIDDYEIEQDVTDE